MRKILISLAFIVATSSGAWADEITDRVVASLRAQGYVIVEMSHTWLGRMWILAQNGIYRREIVFNPGTGEVLRDYSVALATLDAKSRLANNSGMYARPDTASAPANTPAAPIQPNVVAGDPIAGNSNQLNGEGPTYGAYLSDPPPNPGPIPSPSPGPQQGSDPQPEYNIQVVDGPEE